MTHRYQSINCSTEHRELLIQCMTRLGLDSVFVTFGGSRIVWVSERQITYLTLTVPTVRIRELNDTELHRLNYVLDRSDRRAVWRGLWG